jgi:hypothetical protein
MNGVAGMKVRNSYIGDNLLFKVYFLRSLSRAVTWLEPPGLKLPAAPLRGIKQLYLRIIEDKPRAFNVQQIK